MDTDKVHDKARFHMQYQTFNGRFKFVCMIVLILSEYLFLAWHTCINSPLALTTLYPYAAVFLTVYIGVTYYGYNVCFPNCDILSVIVIDFVSYCALLTGMISVCSITLFGCARFAGFSYFLPECQISVSQLDGVVNIARAGFCSACKSDLDVGKNAAIVSIYLQILGLLAAIMLVLNSVFWFCKHNKTFKGYYVNV